MKKTDRKKFRIYFGIILLIVMLFLAGLKLWAGRNSDAAWFDNTWSFRQKISVTAHTAAETNVYFTPTAFDTSDTTKFQADCGDLRFTDASGKLLSYFISSGCGGASTTVHVLVPSFPAGAQDFYMYYGNPSAPNGFSSADFATAATGVTLGSNGSEEEGSAPILYYKFDAASGTTANDAASNSNSGTLGGSTIPTWQTDDLCVSATCLYFDGSSSKVTGSKVVNGIQSISFWLRPNTIATQGLLNLDGGTHIVSTNSSGVISATGFTSPTYYVNGTATSTPTLTANQWNHITITTGTAFNSTSSFVIGGDGTNFIKGFIDEVKFYNYPRTASQVQSGYLQGAGRAGSTVAAGALLKSEFSNGLVGYWKMDEASWTNDCSTKSVIDYSGNLNNGASCPNATGSTTPTTNAKFGRAGNFDGVDDRVDVAHASNLTLHTVTEVAWINITGLQLGDEGVLRKDGSYVMFIANNGKLGARGWDCTSIFSPSVISTGVWHQVAWSFDEHTNNLYLDGQLIATTQQECAMAVTALSVQIGTLDNVFNGKIDEARLYNRILSPNEIKDLYNFAPSPVGYWKLDEGTGTSASDISGYANTGTLSGASVATWKTGKFGSALLFNGTSSYVGAGTGSNLQITGALTLSSWVNLNSNSAEQDVVARNGTSGSYNYRLYVTSSGKLAMDVSSNGTTLFTATGATTLSTGTWYYVSGVYVPSTSLTVYVNGIQDGQNTSSIPSSINNSSSIALNIGAEKDGVSGAGAAFVQECGNNGGAAILSLQVNCTTTAGNLLVLTFQSSTGASRTYTISDSSGTNTWTLCASCEHRPSGISNTGELYYSLTTAATTNVTITVATGLGTSIVASLQEFSGIQASPLDKANNGSDDTGSTSMTSNASGTTTQANEVVAGHLGVQNAGTITGTASGWNYNTTRSFTGTIAAKSGYKILSATGSETNTGTAGTSGRWTANVATFKANTPGGAANFFSGYIDDVKIYNYARSASQITEDMDASHPLGGSPLGSQLINWKFNEDFGTTANNSGNGGSNYNGTITTGTWLTPENCKTNGCINLTGNSSSVSAGDLAFVDGLANFSATMWINPQTLGTALNILSKANTSTQRVFQILSDASTNTEIRVMIASSNSDTSNYCTTSGLGLTASSWQHLAIVYDGAQATGSQIKVFKNGNRVTCTVTGTIPSSMVSGTTSNFTLGKGDDSDNALLSKYDQVKIYDGAITSDQVKIDMNAGASQNFGVTANTEMSQVTDGAGNPAKLYLNFDENSGSTAHDTSGNNVTATTTGSPSWAAGKYGSALVFDGSTTKVSATISDPSNINTLEAWVFPTASAASKTIITASKLTTNGSSQPTYGTCTGTALPLNTWTHIVAISNGASICKIYQNGVATSSNTTGVSFGTSVTVSDTSSGFIGRIDDVKIFDYVRTPAQVAYDYNRGGPIGFWKMNECQGSVIHDSTTLGNNGTLTVGASGTQTAIGTCNTASTAWGNGAIGKFNSSLNFDGTDDFVSIGDISPFEFERTDTFSLSAWFKTTSNTGMSILTKQDNASNDKGYEIQTGGTGLIFFQAVDNYGAGNAIEVRSVSSVNYNDGNWHHLIATYDGSSSASGVKLYFDGKQITTSITIDGLNATIITTAGLQIGARATGGAKQFFNGQIDDASIYNYVLSPNQVRQIYNQRAGVRYGPSVGTP
jgi:hypothetical protein